MTPVSSVLEELDSMASIGLDFSFCDVWDSSEGIRLGGSEDLKDSTDF